MTVWENLTLPWTTAWNYYTSPKFSAEKVWRDTRSLLPGQEPEVRAAVEKEMVKADIASAELAAADSVAALPEEVKAPAPQVLPPMSMPAPSGQQAQQQSQQIAPVFWVLGGAVLAVLAYLAFRKRGK